MMHAKTVPMHTTHIYSLLLVCFQKITNFTGLHRREVNAFKSKFVDYEVILAALIYLRISKYTIPLSDYLQMSGSDYVRAWRQMSAIKKTCKKCAKYSTSARNWFIQWANKQFEDLEFDVVVIPGFKEKLQVCKQKQMLGATTDDEPIADSMKRSDVEVQQLILY